MEVSTIYYIYKIENLINHKIYIGLTNNIVRRKTRHFTDLRCNRHDNHFLQKEFNIYGEDNFSFSVEFEGDVTEKEIGDKEKEFIKKYDSYRNGYNQNEGGNFGASNGGSKLTQSDIFNILSVLDFMSKPGQVLADIYDVSRTTISRIKRGVNHNQYKEEYEKLSLEEKQKIYQTFCESYDFIKKKRESTIIQSKRKLSKEQVFLVLYNYEHRILTNIQMANKVGVKSVYTLDCIKNGLTYQDYALEYKELTEEQKNKLASLLSN